MAYLILFYYILFKLVISNRDITLGYVERTWGRVLCMSLVWHFIVYFVF